MGEVGPGAFYRGGEGGGAGDGEAEVLGRDGGAGGGLEVGGEGAVSREEAGVDGGDDCEEGDFGRWVGAAGAVGGRVAIDAICTICSRVAVDTVRSVGSSMTVNTICSVRGSVAVHTICSISCRTVRLHPIPICLDNLIHEWRRKPLPHGICIERVQELHTATGKQRRKNRIDRAVYMV